jgi:hypothetical protein
LPLHCYRGPDEGISHAHAKLENLQSCVTVDGEAQALSMNLLRSRDSDDTAIMTYLDKSKESTVDAKGDEKVLLDLEQGWSKGEEYLKLSETLKPVLERNDVVLLLKTTESLETCNHELCTPVEDNVDPVKDKVTAMGRWKKLSAVASAVGAFGGIAKIAKRVIEEEDDDDVGADGGNLDGSNLDGSKFQGDPVTLQVGSQPTPQPTR